MKKVIALFLFMLLFFVVSCDKTSTNATTITESNSSTQTTELAEVIDLPFLKPLNLSQAMIGEFDNLLRGQMLYLSDDIMIHLTAEETTDSFTSGDRFITVFNGTSTDYPIGRDDFEFFMGFDQTNNTVYYYNGSSIKHSGDFIEDNELLFYGDKKFINPYLFAYGNNFYDYFGNNLTENFTGTKVIYKYGFGEDIYYHSYNYKETSDEICTISTYQLGNEAAIKNQTLSDGYECGSVKFSDSNYAIIDVYDGSNQIGYISIDKLGNIKTFYVDDYLPQGATLEPLNPFYVNYLYMYIKYENDLGEIYYLMSDLGINNVVTHYDYSDFLYLDEDIFIRESDSSYKFIRDEVTEFTYIEQAYSMGVFFSRVNDYIVINDVGMENLMSFYNLNTKEIEFDLDGYFNVAVGSEEDKILFDKGTYQIYDLINSTTTDLGISDTFKYINNEYGMFYNEDTVTILNFDTLESYEMNLVAKYTTDFNYSQSNYAFVVSYEGIYYILG